MESGDEPEYRLDPGDITFEGKRADLLRRLRRLHDNARTTLEERGVTALHLSFGSLKWEDPVLGESSSPLWLVPCELTSQGPSAPLLLARADEEMQLNPALELYLRERHRVSLPAVPEDPAVEVLARFLDEARAAVREHGWKVEDEVWLSTYSFESLVLYQDLRALAEAAVASDVVIALARAADPPDGSEALGEDELDSLPCPERVPIPVLPVDSSQLKALTVARAGGHVVVHGPPGTGKSQTISNLIADALGENKKVLFVSAKMAALNVVHDRLALLGLGDFCLEAHSTKAGKASIIEDLKRTLGAAQDAGEDRLDEHLDDFLRIRDKLNDTVRELHRRREPLGLSAYRAIGEVERLRSEPEIRGPLPWDDPLKASRADLKEVVEALAELGSQADVFDRRATHPWRGLAVVRETPVRREALEAALMTVRDKGRALQTDLAGLAPLLGSSAPQITCDAATRLAGALADLAALDRLPPYWSARERDEMLATAMVLDAGAADAAELESRQADHDRAFRIPVGEALRLLEPAATQLESWTRVWTPSYWWWRRSIGRHLAQGATGDAAALRTYLAVGRRIRELEESFGGRQELLCRVVGVACVRKRRSSRCSASRRDPVPPSRVEVLWQVDALGERRDGLCPAASAGRRALLVPLPARSTTRRARSANRSANVSRGVSDAGASWPARRCRSYPRRADGRRRR